MSCAAAPVFDGVAVLRWGVMPGDADGVAVLSRGHGGVHDGQRLLRRNGLPRRSLRLSGRRRRVFCVGRLLRGSALHGRLVYACMPHDGSGLLDLVALLHGLDVLDERVVLRDAGVRLARRVVLGVVALLHRLRVFEQRHLRDVSELGLDVFDLVAVLHGPHVHGRVQRVLHRAGWDLHFEHELLFGLVQRRNLSRDLVRHVEHVVHHHVVVLRGLRLFEQLLSPVPFGLGDVLFVHLALLFTLLLLCGIVSPLTAHSRLA